MFHRELFLLGEVKPNVGQIIQIVELLGGNENNHRQNHCPKKELDCMF